jgi:tetratricopeptide (TPR) repeat protein
MFNKGGDGGLRKDMEEFQQTVDQQITALKNSIEKLNAQSNAQVEIRKANNEKFAHIEESIGGIKQSGMQREKDLRKMELQVVKAVELVNSVQPEKIITNVNKIDMKTQALMNKIESFDAITAQIFSELKDMKRVVEVFRGTEEIAKTNQELKKDQLTMQKIFENIKLQADKIESTYLQMKKAYEDVRQFKKEFTNDDNKLKVMEKQIHDIQKSSMQYMLAGDFDEAYKKYSQMIAEMEKTIEKNNMRMEILEEKEKRLAQLNGFMKKEGLKDDDIKAFAQRVGELSRPIEEYKKELEEQQQELGKQLTQHDSQMKQVVESLMATRDEVTSKLQIVNDEYNKVIDKLTKLQGTVFVKSLEQKAPKDVPDAYKPVYNYVLQQLETNKSKALQEIKDKLMQANHTEDMIDFIYKYI